MTGELFGLAERIREEFIELERMVDRVHQGWQKAERSGDDLYIDAVALGIHGFYSGIERLFELIGATVDGFLPEGANWHRMLLDQMAGEIPHVRPAVISGTTRDALDEYRGFRHVVRNVYAFGFDPKKMQKLVEKISDVFENVREELLAFAEFLEQQGEVK